MRQQLFGAARDRQHVAQRRGLRRGHHADHPRQVRERLLARLGERIAQLLRPEPQAQIDWFAATLNRAGAPRERAALVEKSFRVGESSLPDLLRATLAAAQAEVDGLILGGSLAARLSVDAVTASGSVLVDVAADGWPLERAETKDSSADAALPAWWW